jgi:pimeloyl-ACP methyl ester carboxylesterase
MLVTTAAVLTTLSAPILVVSACISKLFSAITGINPVDVSRESFIKEMTQYLPTNGLSSAWVCGRKVHVLCRHATIFSNYPPIVIIHGTGSCSFNYCEFMQSFPKVYDVYCIDLPGWGISEDPPYELGSVGLDRCYAYYANIIMTALSEIYPSKDASYVFVGHSFGSLILTKCIAEEYIPPYKIQRCILVCAPGLHTKTLKYAYLWGAAFITGILESTFKTWWAKHLFSAFLYRKKTQLLTLQNMHRFIPNGTGYKVVGRTMSFSGPLFRPEWIKVINNELIHIFKYSCVDIRLVYGEYDTIVDSQHILQFSNKNNCKCYKVNTGHYPFLEKNQFSNLRKIINGSNTPNNK